MTTTQTWMPLYAELARKVLDYEERQAELLELARELVERGLPIGGLGDRDTHGAEIALAEIDPFTFFSFFNRNTTVENRGAILSFLHDRLDLAAPVPTSFTGIPVVNNQNSWFFPYAPERGPDDIAALWRLARQALTGPHAVEAATFDRCLQIRTVGIAKLTAGLYWLAPTDFLPCDSNTTALLTRLGFAPAVTMHREYAALIARVTRFLGNDFPALSTEAYSPRPQRYWAGGHQLGDRGYKDEFIARNQWRLGWAVDTESADGQQAWALLRQIRPGDELAIKGLGNRNDLSIYYIGAVDSLDLPNAKVNLTKLERPLYQGKAPHAGPGSWFKALREVTGAAAIKQVFSKKVTSSMSEAASDYPKNLILFGPPGTGKTWRVRNQIAGAFHARRPAAAPEHVPADVDQYTWFEIVGAALMDHPDGATVPQLVEHALVRAKQEIAQLRSVSARLWRTLQTHTVTGSTTVNYTTRTAPLVFDKKEGSVWYLPNGPGPQLQQAKDSLRSVPQMVTEQAIGPTEWVTFHQSFGYEDFVEGIRPVLQGGEEAQESLEYELRAGVFLRAVERALQAAGYLHGVDAFCKLSADERRAQLEGAPAQAIFIDEINRGNVARIFGELITLIEPDKRLGTKNELIVRLPTSGQLFGVPANLWIIGTMNTADRSVEALDTALRRRFAFQEVPPEPALLSRIQVEGGIDLSRLLSTINARLLRLYDRDHLIGHSFFGEGPAMSLAELRAIFARQVLPLLQEYFFSDYARIGLILGKRFVRTPPGMVRLAAFDDERRDDLEQRSILELVPTEELDAAAFRSIYEGG